eukprot:56916-Rhodomonas_salina.4
MWFTAIDLALRDSAIHPKSSGKKLQSWYTLNGDCAWLSLSSGAACGLGLVYGTAAMQGDMREWCTKMGVIKPKSTAVPAA